MAEPALDDQLTLRLCRHVAGWRFENLPAPVVRTLKDLLLDTIGVVAGAAHAPGIETLGARLSRWERSGSATGLIGKRRYSPPTAALANGAAAHALDFDDQHDPARSHTSCVMVPALLATAEDIGGVSGREFLLAFAVGAEVEARLGVACHSSLMHGWHPTMTFGTLAASLAAGRLLGLDAEGLRNAFGFAYHQASGSAQSMRDGVLSKRLGPGFAARAAVLSAFLAADGLTGTVRTLEGNAGLFSLYERGEVNAAALMDGLGETWRVPEYSFKPWPGCRCNHTAIGLGLEFHAQGLKPGDVRDIEIGLSRLNWLTVGAPYDAAQGSVTHAQFNAAYSFARALADGRVDLDSYRPQAIAEPGIVAFATRTRVVVDPAIAADSQAARVTLSLRDGRTVEAGKTIMKGGPEDPMTGSELIAKFRGCLRYGMDVTDARADRLAAVIMDIENAGNAARAIVDAFPIQPSGVRGQESGG